MRSILLIFACIIPVFSAELTLRDAQILLKENNYDLRSNAEDVKKSMAEIAEAKSAFYPSFDASLAYNYVSEKGRVKIAIPNFPATTSTSGQNNRTDIGLDVSYPFFTGMSRFNNLESKKSGKAVKEQTRLAIVNRYSLLLGLVYFRWELSSRQLEVRTVSSEQMERYLKQMRILYEGGIVVLSKVLDAEAKLKSAQLDYLLARDQGDSLKLELLSLIGCQDSSYTPQKDSFSIDTVTIPHEVNLSRPEVKVYDINVEQLEFTKKILLSQRYPLVSGLVGYRVGNPGLNTGLNEFMDYITLSAQVKWNLFDGMKNHNQRVQIQQQMAMVAIEKEKSIDTWSRSLLQWKMQISSADEKIAVACVSMDAAQKLVIDLEGSLKAGVVTEVDYTNAVTGLALARLTLEQAKYFKRIAILNVLYSSGKDIVF